MEFIEGMESNTNIVKSREAFPLMDPVGPITIAILNSLLFCHFETGTHLLEMPFRLQCATTASNDLNSSVLSTEPLLFLCTSNEEYPWTLFMFLHIPDFLQNIEDIYKLLRFKLCCFQ